MTRTARSAEEILKQPYPVLLWRDGSSGPFLAEVPDWPGCLAHGSSPESALRKLRDAQRSWLEDCLERGLPIPPPHPPADASGRLVLRLPRSLHRRLALLARTEDVSLNTLLISLLSGAVGLGVERSTHVTARPAAARVAVGARRRG